MTCCVCGGNAGVWQQHWNRDTGYGCCVKCIEWQRGKIRHIGQAATEAEILDLYGKEGVNWGAVQS
jgi:hypothetical protein